MPFAASPGRPRTHLFIGALFAAIAACDGTTAPATPAILSFVATPASLDFGGQTMLSWSTSAADACSIDRGVGPVPCNGTAHVSPDGLADYVLSAAGGGQTVTRAVGITFRAPTVTGLSIASGSPGTSELLEIAGTGFSPTSSVSFDGSGVSATEVDVESPTRITARVSVDERALVGPRALTVSSIGGTSGPASFAVVPNVASLSRDGPYTVVSYTDVPTVPQFPNAIVYYPAEKTDPMGVVTVSPGRYGRAADFAQWAPRIASHGYAVLVFDTHDPANDLVPYRMAALEAATRLMQAEHTRGGSPLEGRLDPDRVSMLGFSLGAAAALIVANTSTLPFKAAIMLSADAPLYMPTSIRAASMIVGAELDAIAPPGPNAYRHYGVIPQTTPKLYVELAGAGHLAAFGLEQLRLARLAVAWLKVHMDGEEAYRPFTVPGAEDAGIFSRTAHTP